MIAKKILDQPDLLVIEGFATLLENGQVLLSNSKIFNFTVTCLPDFPDFPKSVRLPEAVTF